MYEFYGHFVKNNKIDRAIIVNSSIEFEEPIPSGITKEILHELNLTKLHENMIEGDRIEYWSKNEIEWPQIDWP